MKKSGDNIREVKPEIFSLVPRLLEKVYDKIIAKGECLISILNQDRFSPVSLEEQVVMIYGGMNNFLLEFGLGKLSILINIFKEKYDVVIVFRSDYSKSAELFSNITNAKYKIGVKNPKGKDNFNVHIPVDNKKHEVEFCFDCLESLGVKYEKERTRYYIPNELSDKYKEYSNHILFHISSRIKDNQYSNDNFLKVINELKNYNILISAEPVDFDNAKYIESNSHAKFIKTSSLNDLGGLISNVKLFITLDGGAMHLGSALGIKTISISGKTNIEIRKAKGIVASASKDVFANKSLVRRIMTTTVINDVEVTSANKLFVNVADDNGASPPYTKEFTKYPITE